MGRSSAAPLRRKERPKTQVKNQTWGTLPVEKCAESGGYRESGGPSKLPSKPGASRSDCATGDTEKRDPRAHTQNRRVGHPARWKNAIQENGIPRKAIGRESGGKPPHSKMTEMGLEVEEAVCGDDEEEGEGGDGDFADGAYGEGAEALFAHFAEVGAQADTGEGEKESPAGEIGESEVLVLGEEVVGGENGNENKAEDELGEFLPEEGGFVADSFGLALAGPVDGVGQNDEADHGVARGFDEDGKFGGGVGIESASGGGFGGVVYGEAGPETVGLIGEMERVTDEREGE